MDNDKPTVKLIISPSGAVSADLKDEKTRLAFIEQIKKFKDVGVTVEQTQSAEALHAKVKHLKTAYDEWHNLQLWQPPHSVDCVNAMNRLKAAISAVTKGC